MLWIALFVLVALLGLFVVGMMWGFWWSIKVVGADEVGIRLYFGHPEELVYQSGPVFVPWIPIRWDGHRPWELVRIPTKAIPFRWEGALEHKVWSSDRQALLVEVSGYVRFPYEEADSLVNMIRSGVPTEQLALQGWIKDEVISGLRDIMAGHTMEQAIARSSLTTINSEAQTFFLRQDGLFAKSGICGNDAANFTPGTGEVILRVDQISPTPEVQRAMEKPVTARFEADAAAAVARMNAEQVGGQVLAIVARQHGMSVEELEQDLKAHPEKRGIVVSKKGYKESFLFAQQQVQRDRAGEKGTLSDVRIGSSDGTPLPKGLQYLSVGGSGGNAGVLLGSGRRNRDKDKPSNRQRANEADED